MFSNPPDVSPSVNKPASHDSAAFTGTGGKKLFWPVPGASGYMCVEAASWHAA